MTGIGAVTPLGHGIESVWNLLLNGGCGVSRIPEELSQSSGGSIKVAAMLPPETAVSSSFPPDVLNSKHLSKATKYALISSDLALAHAGLFDSADRSNSYVDKNRFGVAIASGMGSLSDIVESSRSLDQSYKKLSPYFVPKVLINMSAGQVSIRHKLGGPVHSVATACAAGSHAIGDAYNFIRLGYADAMLAGGTEFCIDPLSIAGFARMKALSTSDSSSSSRPFDSQRDGFVIGEGSCILVLEELESALRRGAEIIAEVSGYGLSGDAYHATTPPGDGNGARRSMLSALKDAGLQPSDIGYINAHATSTPLGDGIETSAIESVFNTSRQHDLFVSSTKGATGHLLGAAGAIESAFACLAVRDSIIPLTKNLQQPNPAPSVGLNSRPIFLHVMGKSLNVELKHALNNSFGFGGTNASLIFSKYTK